MRANAQGGRRGCVLFSVDGAGESSVICADATPRSPDRLSPSICFRSRDGICVDTGMRCTAVLKDLQEGRISGADVTRSVIAVAKVAEEQMGGTSGALYS